MLWLFPCIGECQYYGIFARSYIMSLEPGAHYILKIIHRVPFEAPHAVKKPQ